MAGQDAGAGQDDPGRRRRRPQPWLLSPELVSTSYAAAKYGISDPVTRQVGPAAFEVGARNSEWVATLYLAQPIRQGTGGVWIITRTANPAGSY